MNPSEAILELTPAIAAHIASQIDLRLVDDRRQCHNCAVCKTCSTLAVKSGVMLCEVVDMLPAQDTRSRVMSWLAKERPEIVRVGYITQRFCCPRRTAVTWLEKAGYRCDTPAGNINAVWIPMQQEQTA